MRKLILICSVFIAILFTFFTVRPHKDLQNPKKCIGEVLSIREGGIKDVVLEIRNEKNTFYINRGYENYEMSELKSLIGKTVTIYFSEGWSLFNVNESNSKNIEKLLVNNTTFFSEEM
jgi:hypothetical protein